MISHIEHFCKKVAQKKRGSILTVNSIEQFSEKVVFSSFIESEFNCFHRIWMFCSRKLNHIVENVHNCMKKKALNQNISYELGGIYSLINGLKLHERFLSISGALFIRGHKRVVINIFSEVVCLCIVKRERT